MARRKLDGKEYDELRTRHKVGSSNFGQFFEKEGEDIYFNPQDSLVALQDEAGQRGSEYEKAREDLEQSTLSRLDLPSLFKKAAREANPNFGLSRSEILTRFDDPQYSDTKSSSYVDPHTRVAIANRQRQGYQAVLGDAVDRADAILGRDVASKQFAFGQAGDVLTGTNEALDTERGRREGLAKEDRKFERDMFLKQLGGSGGGRDKPDVKVRASFEGERSFDPVTGEFITRSPGLSFSDKTSGLPISPIAAAERMGKRIDDLLASSPDKGDQDFVLRYRDLLNRQALGEDVSGEIGDLRGDFQHIFAR